MGRTTAVTCSPAALRISCPLAKLAPLRAHPLHLAHCVELISIGTSALWGFRLLPTPAASELSAAASAPRHMCLWGLTMTIATQTSSSGLYDECA